MKVNAVQLRAHLDAMHAEADARDLRSEAIRKIVKDAKDHGYDGKALRKVFVRERMDAEKRQHDDDLLTAYEGALGGKGRALAAILAGVPVGEACEANGVHRATVARARNVAKQPSNATPPHDTETGEISNRQQEDSHETMLSPRSEALPGNLIAGAVDTTIDEQHSGEPHACEQSDNRPDMGEGAGPRIPSRSPPIDTRTFDEIVGEHPAFLRRTA